METQPPTRRSERWLEKRIERKGLRPRDAAYLIAVFWTIAVLAFGVVERLVDPKTFHSIWLGMWWAVETVTTVGYGDIVPDQTAGKIIAGVPDARGSVPDRGGDGRDHQRLRVPRGRPTASRR